MENIISLAKLCKTYSEIVCDTGVEMGRVARGCEGGLMLRSDHISSRTGVLKSFTLVLWIMKFACFAMVVTAMFLAVAAKQPYPVDGSAALTATMPLGSQTACHGFFNSNFVQFHSVYAIASQRAKDSYDNLVDTTTYDLLCWRYGQARWPFGYIPHRVAGRCQTNTVQLY